MSAKRRGKKEKTIRIGVVGARRGSSFCRMAGAADMELVAVCDKDSDARRRAEADFGVAVYEDFDLFLEHEMDAVALANYFHEHAPLALRALDAGLHVLSETASCKTLAEGVALLRAVRRSGRIYMLAENCCYFPYVQEMERLYRAGEIGEVQYAEGEYIHPASSEQMCRLAPGENHWRNWIPSTYYSSHALAPLMSVTRTMPVQVNALSIPRSDRDREVLNARRGDPGSVILCRMDNDAVFTINGLMLRGHNHWYRFHGTRGVMENLRLPAVKNMVRVSHESFDRREGDVGEKVYEPELRLLKEEAKRAGHGGADVFTNYYFARAIRSGRQPWLDARRGVAMAAVAVQAWRSALDGGAPYPVPDFSKASVLDEYEDDHWSPFPEDAGPGQPPPSMTGFNPPGRKAMAFARRVWRGE